jgi:VanZ family protein
MIRTAADARLEHAAAYLISGLSVFTAYPRRLKCLIAILMPCYAGILEFGQLWVPGRHAGILDWAASSSGVLCALLLYDAYQRVYASKSPREYAEAPLNRP